MFELVYDFENISTKKFKNIIILIKPTKIKKFYPYYISFLLIVEKLKEKYIIRFEKNNVELYELCN